jgi:hypothetical protein
MIKKYYRSLKNKIIYGSLAPEYAELIFINPKAIKKYSFAWKPTDSGKVVGGDWDDETRLIKIKSRFKYKACKQRWENNISWQDTGIYDFMLDFVERRGAPVDKCKTLEDIQLRYERLDELFEQVKQTGHFKTQKELNSNCFNEEGGILVHIGRNNQLIFGGGGIHRLAIAKILKLGLIPAQIGVVHPKAIKTWKAYKLENLRDPAEIPLNSEKTQGKNILKFLFAPTTWSCIYNSIELIKIS